jgi:CRP-like cAMP-binding protein
MRHVPIQGALRREVEDVLDDSDWFRALRREDQAKAGSSLERLIASADLIEYAPGEVIIRQGYPSDRFYIMVRGSARVRVGEEKGAEAEVGWLRRPASFGEVGLLLNEPRSATVAADATVLALSFDATAFHEVFKKIPEFGLETSRHLARRLRAVTRLVPLPESDLEDASGETPSEAEPEPHTRPAPALPNLSNVPIVPPDEE